MKPDLTQLSDEELKRILHNENFKFFQGLENGASFNELKKIRQKIRSLQSELEGRISHALSRNQLN